MSQLPNPFTPLAFFPPDVADQVVVFYYVSVGTMAVFVWDVLDNLHGDYRLVSNYRVTFTSGVYLWSRWSTLAYMLTNVIVYTAPIGNCRKIGLATGWLYPFSMACTSLLFLIRVYAIYNRHKAVSSIFFILWVGVIIGSSTIPFSTRAAEIGPTKFCFTDIQTVPSYLTASGVLTLIFDTSVYLAITWKLTRDAYSFRSRPDKGILTLLSFRNIPIFSRALLRDGQKYYLTTTTAHLFATILFNIDSLPLPYRFLLGLPSQAIMNIMACQVYRSTRFGIFDQVMIAPTSKIASTRREARSEVTIEFSKIQGNIDVELGIVTKSSPGIQSGRAI